MSSTDNPTWQQSSSQKQSLSSLLSALENGQITLSIRGLLYNKVAKAAKGVYLFSHTQNTNRLETILTYLQRWYADGRLFQHASNAASTKPSGSLSEPAPKTVVNKPTQSSINLVTPPPVSKANLHSVIPVKQSNAVTSLAGSKSIVTATSIQGLQVKYDLTQQDAKELHELLAEMRPLNFRYSKQLSQYIVANRLGRKYPNIAGIARMSDGVDRWDFDGGFPTHIYRIICTELCLQSQGSNAHVIGFSSYKSRGIY